VLRVDLGRPLDPRTAVAGAVEIRGLHGGDVSGRIERLTLDPSGRAITVRLSAPLPDADVYTFRITDVLRTTSGEPLPGDAATTVAALAGDVDASGAVTAVDILAVRAHAGKPVDAATRVYDVNDSGDVTGADMLAARTRLGRRLPQ